MNVIAALSTAVVFALRVLTTAASADVRMSVDPGPVNGVLLEANGSRLAVYGWKPDNAVAIDYVLLAHGRRDIVWKAKPLIDAGTKVIAPNRERFALEQPRDFWKEFATGRFHDYAQQTTKILPAAVPVERWVNDGDTIEWQGVTLRAVETPGFTRGSVSWRRRSRSTRRRFQQLD